MPRVLGIRAMARRREGRRQWGIPEEDLVPMSSCLGGGIEKDISI